MIKSQYITNIVKLLLDFDEESRLTSQQIKYLTVDKLEYTGSGLFASFKHSKSCLDYKCPIDNLVLTGLKITSAAYSIEADANLFFKNGIVDYLEIWCYSGEYPSDDLAKYKLTQNWENSPGYQISTE